MKELRKEVIMQVRVAPEELHGLKLVALQAHMTLKKYVRLKLGLDKEDPKRKAS